MINDMTFLNAVTGYISACGGKVFRTTNSGITWSTFNTGSTSCFSTITFLNSQTGWVSAQSSYTSNTVYKTINGGVNWFLLGFIPGIERTFRIRFTDNQTGWAGGQKNSNYDGIFLRTTNGGANWIVTLDAADEVDDFCFINSQTGWAVSGGRVYKSTNSGGNWSEQLHVAGLFSTCYFVDLNTGWAQGLSGSDGIMYKTTNSGLNWTSQTAAGSYNLLTMHFINAQTGWTAGLLGKMYKTTNGGDLITGTTSNEEKIPGSYLLEQNYPNPFNPTTNIRFAISKFGFVKLTVFDIKGREIETLVNENLNAGTYNADWNAVNHSSGVYFYRLEGEGFTETKKMLILK
jgi:photosystem II stability/assembly factor-like uncharacterized protein